MIDRLEPHDTLEEVRDFLRSLPNGGPDDLARKVTSALYAERKKPARDGEGWSHDMGVAPRSPVGERQGPIVLGWGRYQYFDNEPEQAVFMRWRDGDYPGWYGGITLGAGEFIPRAWRPLLEGPGAKTIKVPPTTLEPIMAGEVR